MFYITATTHVDHATHCQIHYVLEILVPKDTRFKKLNIVYPVLSTPYYRGILTSPPLPPFPPSGGGKDGRRDSCIGIHTTYANAND